MFKFVSFYIDIPLILLLVLSLIAAIVKDVEGLIDWYTLDDGELYGGNRSLAIQPVGIALGDLDGDGFGDLAVANFVSV